MPPRRRFLTLFVVLVLPCIAVVRAPYVRADLRLVNGWICKPSDLHQD
jgi:hypothetical protein